MRDVFKYDFRVNSGFKKKFLERTQEARDALWFDIGKEIFKSAVLIVTTLVTAALIIRFGLQCHLK